MDLPNRILHRNTMKFVREDRARSWAYLLSTLLLVILFFSLSFLADALVVRFFSGICAGLVMGRLFVIYHDYNHKAILYNSKPAGVIMWILGVFMLAPNNIWNLVHNHHHDHNSKFSDVVLGSFPTITKIAFESMSKPEKIKYLGIRHPITILFSYLSVFLVSFCLYPFFENPKKYWDGLLSFILHTVVILLVTLYWGISFAILGIMLPFFVLRLLGGYIFYAQHNFPGVQLMENNNWDYTEAALKSSSYIKMNRFWEWVTANVGYHHVHHVNARIPFYYLPEAMKNIPEFQNPITTSLSFKDIRACLALKLWDSEKREMVGIKR